LYPKKSRTFQQRGNPGTGQTTGSQLKQTAKPQAGHQAVLNRT